MTKKASKKKNLGNKILKYFKDNAFMFLSVPSTMDGSFLSYKYAFLIGKEI